MDVPTPSFSVETENVSLDPLFVTTMMTVETEAMNTLAVWWFPFWLLSMIYSSIHNRPRLFPSVVTLTF